MSDTKRFDFEHFSSVGEILVRNRVITRTQLGTALTRQREDRAKRLGDLMVELGLATQAEVDAAILEQDAHRTMPNSAAANAAVATVREACQRVAVETDRLTEIREKKATVNGSPFTIKISP